MKLFQSAIFRTICAILVGILLLHFRGQTLQWLTIVIGAIFFATGLISCIVYYFTKKRLDEAQEIFDQDGNKVTRTIPSFPIVGIGSMILGGILIFLPGDFNKGMIIALALILVIGAFNQLVSLGRATKFAHVPVMFWIFPLVTLAVGVYALFNSGKAIDAIMEIIGTCMIFYGAVELLNTMKIYQMRRAYDKANANLKAAAEARAKMQDEHDITDAEVVADDSSETQSEEVK